MRTKIMSIDITEKLKAELWRYADSIDKEALVRFLAGLYDKESGGFYYSNSARDNEGFYPDIESTAQAMTILSSLGVYTLRDRGTDRCPEWYCEGLAKFFYERQDEETGFFFDTQFGKDVNESKKGRNTAQASTRLRELGVKPKYLLPAERVKVEKSVEVLADHYGSLEKFDKWLRSMDWDSDDDFKPYYWGNMLAASRMSIEAAGLLDYTQNFLDSIQNKETGLWGKGRTSNAMNAAMKISHLYDSAHKYPNVEKMIESIAEIVEHEEPDVLSTLWNPLVLVQNILRDYGEIPDELRAVIDEKKLPLVKTCVDRMSVFKKPDGGYSYGRNNSSPTSQGARVSLGLFEGDVNATMLGTASLLSSIAYVTCGEHEPPILKDYNRLFFELIEGKHKK